MTEPFPEFMNRERADPDTVQQTARYYVAARSGFLSPEEMLEQLARTVPDAAELRALLDVLERDATALDELCLTVLSAAWEEPGEAETIKRLVADAKQQLPIIAIGAVAIAALYGVYLLRDADRRAPRRATVRAKDGTVTDQPPVDDARHGAAVRAARALVEESERRP